MAEYVHTGNEGGVQSEVLSLFCIPAFPAMLNTRDSLVAFIRALSILVAHILL
jgi:hypothetical protein